MRSVATDRSVRPAPGAFTTDAVPAPERLGYWRDALRRSLDAHVEVEAASPNDFNMRMQVQEWPWLRIIELQGSAHRTHRRGQGRAGAVSLLLQLQGLCTSSAGRHEVSLGPGDMTIVPPDRELVTVRHGMCRQLLVDVQREWLSDSLPQWTAMTSRCLPARDPAVAALSDLMCTMSRHAATWSDDAREGLCRSLYGLLPSVVSSAGQAGARPGAARAGSTMTGLHRQRAQAYIAEHLGDPGLSVRRIADALGVSVRYVHKLFDDAGGGVMQRVLMQRLLACHDELRQRGSRSVASVAYGWGFSSPAHFSRCFRRHFGVPPSQV